MKRSNLLNELMIVNPGNLEDEDFLSLGQMSLNEGDIQYLGEDETLYRVAGFNTVMAIPSDRIGFDTTSIGPYFLGEDGTVYKILNT